MNRVAVFAHYDKKNKIQDYVVYYLQELKKVVNKIVFVSDSNVLPEELAKLNGIIDQAIAEKHGEYDFGSYKRGYFYAKDNGWLENCDEFIIANDSCYGPLHPLETIFDDMSARPVDFWGITANPVRINGPALHIQSYFVVFKQNVFSSQIFNDFLSAVKKEPEKDVIILKYEIGLSKLLFDNAFKYDVYCQLSKILPHPTIYYSPKLLEEDKNPFSKTSIYRKDYTDIVSYPSFVYIKNYTNYDINLILSDLKQNLSLDKIKGHPIELLKFLRKILIRFSLKERTIIILGNKYKF